MERDEFTYEILKEIQNGKQLHWSDFSMNQEQFEAEIDTIKKNHLVQIDGTSDGEKGPELTSEGITCIEEYEQE
ncbi:hypothetical protein ACH0BF_01000 [Pseudobacillus sp. 179-B 2D1 NHS]|uniref:hypothetical protein n=1 Tax=Pseudobacillus sp. 179-B 2D1 NHS TaxID=3374292 RepID=UPI0038796BA8